MTISCSYISLASYVDLHVAGRSGDVLLLLPSFGSLFRLWCSHKGFAILRKNPGVKFSRPINQDEVIHFQEITSVAALRLKTLREFPLFFIVS